MNNAHKWYIQMVLKTLARHIFSLKHLFIGHMSIECQNMDRNERFRRQEQLVAVANYKKYNLRVVKTRERLPFYPSSDMQSKLQFMTYPTRI